MKGFLAFLVAWPAAGGALYALFQVAGEIKPEETQAFAAGSGAVGFIFALLVGIGVTD